MTDENNIFEESLEEIEGYNNGDSTRYNDRAHYGSPFTKVAYNNVRKNPEIRTMHKYMNYLCQRSFSVQKPYRKYKVIFDGAGEQNKTEKKRQELIDLAIEHDKNYPNEVWATMIFELGKDIRVEFYDSTESVLKNHFHGKCFIESSQGGMVRIFKPYKIVRIFYLPPRGAFEYRRMKFNPVTGKHSVQNLYMFERLVLSRGYVYNPGYRFLDKNYPDFGLKTITHMRNYAENFVPRWTPNYQKHLYNLNNLSDNDE